jgi:hypothetical protein
VYALVDDRLPEGRRLLARLRKVVEARSGLDDLPSEPQAGDALLIFADGVGEGLEYSFDLPTGRIGVLDLARARLPSRVVAAACRSGRPPPRAFPLAVPTALHLAGVRTVVAGLWPLGAASTVDLLSQALLGWDGRLGATLRTSMLARSSANVAERGLAVFGRDDG